jgi:hypothetical protein
MASDQTFEQQLQSHMCDLVRVREVYGGIEIDLKGKIGLLMSATRWHCGPMGEMQIELLIDGRFCSIYVYPHELEFIGADDAS